MRARVLAAIAHVLLTSIAFGCAPAEEEPDESTPSPTATPSPMPTPAAFPSPACFTGGTVPQIDFGNAPGATDWTWNDPSVLEVGTEYWMYASATDYFDFPVRLYRLVSTDGATWALDPPTPILADAGPGEWDSGGMETPSVAFFDGVYHLFYTGYPIAVDEPGHDPLTYRFGHATSLDGITFTRDGAGPIVEPSGTDGDPTNDWHAYIAAEPGAVVHEEELLVYFTTIGVNAALGTTLQVIGMVTSTNGDAFSAPRLALEPDQTVYPRGDDWLGYSTPSATVIDGAVHLFVDVAHQPEGGSYRQMKLHHASSSDGRDGWVQDATAIVTVPFSDWAIDQVNGPFALLAGDQLRLYFAGQDVDFVDPDHFAIAMMTCGLLAEAPGAARGYDRPSRSRRSAG
jgi:hypothetical protein